MMECVLEINASTQYRRLWIDLIEYVSEVVRTRDRRLWLDMMTKSTAWRGWKIYQKRLSVQEIEVCGYT